jgi:la-related protein 1
LDPTRWYLLGQLEYYLSPQNLAQDFFLRQRVSHTVCC